MILHENYEDVQSFQTYLRDVRQNDEKTVKRRRPQLRHLLEWADETPLPQAHKIRPTFPEYLLSARNDNRAEPMALSTRKSNCEIAQVFFHWAKDEHPIRYRAIKPAWIESVRAKNDGSASQKREYFTIDEIRELVALPVDTLMDIRDLAAIGLLFISGARVGAFVSLPIGAVDLQERAIDQSTLLGVHTKFKKSAKTFLLDVPECVKIVTRWDDIVRSSLPKTALWYATLNADGTRFTGATIPGKDRRTAVAKGINRLCARAGIPYRSPHALRRGHITFVSDRVTDARSARALSENVMHDDWSTTFKYIQSTEQDRKEYIRNLTRPEQVHSSVPTDAQSIACPYNAETFAEIVAEAVIRRLSTAETLSKLPPCPSTLLK